MDERRKDIDDFMQDEWVPVFAEEYFRQPQISAVWDQVFESNDPGDRLKLLTLVGPALQKRISEERQKLIDPIDELEKQLERQLRDEYWQMKSMNNSITSFLASAAEVQESRDRLMAMAGIDKSSLLKTLGDTEAAVENLISGEGSPKERFAAFKTKIRSLRDKNGQN